MVVVIVIGELALVVVIVSVCWGSSWSSSWAC